VLVFVVRSIDVVMGHIVFIVKTRGSWIRNINSVQCLFLRKSIVPAYLGNILGILRFPVLELRKVNGLRLRLVPGSGRPTDTTVLRHDCRSKEKQQSRQQENHSILKMKKKMESRKKEEANR
jgi:hypothetical protein